MAAEKLGAMQIAELLLTAAIYNQSEKLAEGDLPARVREHYFDPGLQGVDRPIFVTRGDVEKILGVDNVDALIKELPFLEFEEPDSRVKLKDFNAGAEWFASQDSYERIQSNPVLAHYYQKYDPNFCYITSKSAKLSQSVDHEGVEARIEQLWADEKEAEELLKLVTIKDPERIRNSLDDLVLTEDQWREIAKAGKALEHRQYLRDVGLYEIGKILFVGPPGTGKTTAARALSRWFGLPLLEVRLPMTISHYLGETSKNVDRVFTLAKRLSPCILFIDEFDFVAKTRTADDHGAMKRAVNTLLKAIDDVSLVEDGVLVIAATNYPQLLDYAAWRRFDKVLRFDAPDVEMRRKIIEKVLHRIDAEVDPLELAELTDGYTGSDLRLVVREAILNALLQDRKSLDQEDLLRAVEELRRRKADYRQANNNWRPD